MYSYHYPRAALTVDAIVVANSTKPPHLLLIKRGKDPFKGRWALPGGFINLDETLKEACQRELCEETGLIVDKLTQFKAYDAIGRDPRGRTISVVFFAFLEKLEMVEGMDDASFAQWFPLNNLPKLAFDHEEIISQFIQSPGLGF